MNELEVNYTKEAFLHPWNLSFLIVSMLIAFVVSMAGVTWPFETVLLFSAAAELIFLGTLPRQDRFRRAVRSRQALEHAKPPSQKELFHSLTKHSQRKYARLKRLQKDIAGNYRKLSYASQGMLDSHLDKINGLLDSYLNLLYQKERYEFTSRASTETEVVQAMARLRTDMEDDPPRVKAVKARRLRILEQRLDRSKRGQENLEIIKAQLETVEDVTKYILEQSLTLRNPEEITFQLDTLLSEVEETQASVIEMEEVFASPTDLLTELDTFENSTKEESSTDNTRVRE